MCSPSTATGGSCLYPCSSGCRATCLPRPRAGGKRTGNNIGQTNVDESLLLHACGQRVDDIGVSYGLDEGDLRLGGSRDDLGEVLELKLVGVGLGNRVRIPQRVESRVRVAILKRDIVALLE